MATHTTDIMTAFPDRHAKGVTPMIAQFLEVKEGHADCLLFYRMGDFYEMFFKDAVDAAEALDITLTKRGKVEDVDVPMCGVPVHAAETYLSRLIKKGFRVAICEQGESPEEAKKRGNKGPLKRDVTRIVTPGTLVEDEFLPPRENNFLVALGEVKSGDASGRFALSWVDLSTGDFFVETVSPDRIEETLARLSAAELIISDQPEPGHDLSQADTLGLVGCVSRRPAGLFDSREGERHLCEIYGVTTLDGIADLSRADLAAAGALVAYLDQTQKGRNLRLKPIRKMINGDVLEIDPATRRSLEIAKTLSGKTQGSLLAAIDKSVTAAGGRLLAGRISAPVTNIDVINERLDLAEAMLSNPTKRLAIEAALKKMPDLERSLSRLTLGHGGPRDVAAIAQGLHSTAEMAAILDTQKPSSSMEMLIAAEQMSEMAKILLSPHDLAAQIDKRLDEDLPLMARDGGFIKTGFHSELDELKALRDESRRLIAQLQTKYCDETGIGSLKIKHNNVLGYHIDVRTNHAEKLMESENFIHRQTTAQAMRFTTTELADLESKMSGAGDRATALEVELFEEIRAVVLSYGDQITGAAEAAARLDVAVATALLAERWSYTRPNLNQSRELHIQDGRHPVVEQMLDKTGADPFITNDCALDEDARIWLLTGPNMAGKSTFLRQNALIVMMAQAGFYVPASNAAIGIVDRLFCRVGASDDLATGRSTFMVEMVETAAILNRAGERTFVILDEIGRGTSTFDGLSLAWAVVEHLHEVNCCRTLFATHYHELNALQGILPALSSHAMQVREWQEDIIFLHKVAAGAADRSYGIHVARLAGVPQAVLSRAEEVLTRLSEEKGDNDALGELPLFSADDDRHASQFPGLTAEQEELYGFIDHLLPDTMTPRDAMDAIYALKALKDKA
jgi:DNA mismatch repair protein MutS